MLMLSLAFLAVVVSSAAEKEDPTPAMPTDWATRKLVPPKGLESLKPADVFFMMGWKVQPPGPHGIDWNKRLVGEKDLSSMRIGPGFSPKEAEQAIKDAVDGVNYVDQTVVVRGSDLLGGKIVLGWTAWVVVSSWWPDTGYGYPNDGAGISYGAATLDEALREAFRMARANLRKVYSGPICSVYIEAGISTLYQRDLYVKNGSATNVGAMPYRFSVHTPSTKRDAEMYNFTMHVPEDPEEFPTYVRVTLKGRYYPFRDNPRPESARWYGSNVGFMNAPVMFNGHWMDPEAHAAHPEYSWNNYRVSDEPPPFTVAVDPQPTAKTAPATLPDAGERHGAPIGPPAGGLAPGLHDDGRRDPPIPKPIYSKKGDLSEWQPLSDEEKTKYAKDQEDFRQRMLAKQRLIEELKKQRAREDAERFDNNLRILRAWVQEKQEEQAALNQRMIEKLRAAENRSDAVTHSVEYIDGEPHIIWTNNTDLVLRVEFTYTGTVDGKSIGEQQGWTLLTPGTAWDKQEMFEFLGSKNKSPSFQLLSVHWSAREQDNEWRN